MNSPGRARVVVLMLGVLGCASAGHPHSEITDSTPRTVVTSQTGQVLQTTDVSSAREIKVAASADAVMTALAQVYTELNIPIGTLQTGARRIGNANFRVVSHSLGGRQVSAFLDCGQSPPFGNRADQSSVTISILSTVVATGDSTSVLTTELGGQARSLAASTEAVRCQSTGVLEGQINIRVVTLTAPKAN